MLPGQMKKPPPLDTPATTHPVSENAALEISDSKSAACIVSLSGVRRVSGWLFVITNVFLVLS